MQRKLVENGFDWDDRRVQLFARLIGEIRDLPRHLGQHTGGMVIAKGQLDDVVPLEPATMPGRVVLQWDKDDVADLHLIKIDLLGLGMMAALQDTLSLLKGTGVESTSRTCPRTTPRSTRCCRQADTVGVFQVESRAQMATLPRLKPTHFYDLVVEVAIIRPGPIVGNMVHPVPAPPRGQEPVVYAHPQPGADPVADPRRAPLPGAAPAHGHGRRELHGRRGGGPAPGAWA